jgi:hypothetical protein
MYEQRQLEEIREAKRIQVEKRQEAKKEKLVSVYRL